MPESSVQDLARTADLTVRSTALVRRLFASRITSDDRRALKRLGHQASQRGFGLFLVGGVVRDLLLGRSIRDLDVAVTGEPQSLATGLGGTLEEHRAFGTARLRLPDGVHIDLARTRSERYPRPAALPEVAAADLAEDLARRDFAVNAMAVPLASDGPRGLIDPFAGREDLRRRRVRVLHRRSFEDDPTRAYRAARIAARLGFRIETVSAGLIGEALDQGWFDWLSAARLRREIQHTLEEPHPGRSVRMLARFDLFSPLDPALRVPRGAPAAVDRVPSALQWFESLETGDPIRRWLVGFALLLRGNEPEIVERVLNRLRPSRSEQRTLRDAVSGLGRLPRELSAGRRHRASEIDAACRGLDVEALMSISAGTTSPTVRNAIRRYLKTLRDVRADITGRDLIRGGIPPGPAVSRGLDAARLAKMDGAARGRAEQLRIGLAAARRS